MPTVFLITITVSLVGLIVALRRPQTLSKYLRIRIPRLLQGAFFLSLLLFTFRFMADYTIEPEDPPIKTTPPATNGEGIYT